MDNIERRQKGLAYISDENVMAQQKVTRVKNQEFNTMDRSDFEALSKKIYDILGKAGSNAFVNPPFTVIMVLILKSEIISMQIIILQYLMLQRLL